MDKEFIRIMRSIDKELKTIRKELQKDNKIYVDSDEDLEVGAKRLIDEGKIVVRNKRK